MSQPKCVPGMFLLSAVLAACSDSSASAPGAVGPTQPSDSVLTDGCPVTIPNGSNPPTEQNPSTASHGNGALWTALGPGGKIVATPNYVHKDGSIDWKIGWYRGVRGKLTVTGRRLDAVAPPVQGDYEIDYGDFGFQSGGILFPTEGCWEITGTVGDASLTFVTLVAKVPFEPAWPRWGPDGTGIIDYDTTGLPDSLRIISGFPSGEDGEFSIETTQGIRENDTPHPEGVQQLVMVGGQAGVCVLGAWDEQGQWQAEADAGVLEWSAGGFSYRITHTGLALDCEDLLRIAGASS